MKSTFATTLTLLAAVGLWSCKVQISESSAKANGAKLTTCYGQFNIKLKSPSHIRSLDVGSHIKDTYKSFSRPSDISVRVKVVEAPKHGQRTTIRVLVKATSSNASVAKAAVAANRRVVLGIPKYLSDGISFEDDKSFNPICGKAR